MNIILKTVDIGKIVNRLLENKIDKSTLIIQYADFNVLNYFYENSYELKDLENIYLYPDSTILYFYIKIFINRDFKKLVSTDIQDCLLYELNKISSTLFLFGDSDPILNIVMKNIQRKHPKINIAGCNNGYNYDTEEVIIKINKNEVDILFVGLGVGRQEKWILENYNKLETKVIISIGGWFQYLAGNKKRAPILLRKMHLEWLHKLTTEFPRVWKRYIIGVPKFIYRVLTKKITITCDQT